LFSGGLCRPFFEKRFCTPKNFRRAEKNGKLFHGSFPLWTLLKAWKLFSKVFKIAVSPHPKVSANQAKKRDPKFGSLFFGSLRTLTQQQPFLRHRIC